MKILVLRGKANSGKTSSLKNLMLMLLKYPNVKVVYSSKLGTKEPQELIKRIKEKWTTKSNNVSDLTLLLCCNKKRILITSMGDSLNDINSVLNYKLKTYGNIDLFICGRHHKNNIEAEFSEYNIETPIVVDKERSLKTENFEKDNCNTAQKLFDIVKKILNL